MTKRAATLGLSILLGIGSRMINVPVGAEGPSSKQHQAQGIVLQVDKAHKSLEVSCDQIPDYMDAMDMAFTLRTPADLNVAASLKPGTKIRFTIEGQGKSLYANNIQIETSAVFEPEPMEASGLTALHKALNPSQAASIIGVGQPVPDFALTDQTGNVIRLSQFHGKVVALTFGYSRCPNPNYCYRLSNNLAHVQRQLREHARKDLVLLTIAIDPDHDKGEVLAEYAQAFRADPEMWHFLTGPVPEIQKIAAYFGMNFWNNEGLLTHSLHTVILDRDGRLAANLEGNQFTPQQLTDLVRSVMSRSH